MRQRFVNTREAHTIRWVNKKNSSDEVRAGINEFYPRLWRFCLFLTGHRSDAEDLLHTTCLRALERSDQFQKGTNISGWLFTIARHSWMNEVRSRKVRRGNGASPIENLDLADEKPHGETNVFAAEVLEQIRALPEAQRVTVLLVYIEGHRYSEAADILGIPIGTVMSRLAAARKSLNMKLGAKGEGGSKQ